jgi:hypothetical protein
VALRSAVSQVKPKRAAAVVAGTVITSATDLNDSSANGTLTPGRDARLSGSKLKTAGYKPEAGGGGAKVAEAKVYPSDIVANNPSEVIA